MRPWRPLSVFLVIPFALSLFTGCSRSNTGGPDVVVWTYDSFVSEWGPATQAAAAFKAHTGLTVQFMSQGDGGALLAKAMTEGSSCKADILLGIDQNLMPKAAASALFEAYKPKGADSLPKELLLDSSFLLTPYDYGNFSIIYDSESIKEPPRSLEDLTDPRWAKKLILMDPRTSTPGLGFLAWTQAAYGKDWKAYWKRLAPSILTVSDGWDSGYGMFTRGEAPLVLSYTTSPAYHVEYEHSERFKAALFSQGHALQIEGAGLLKEAGNKAAAKKFLDFMLSPEFQSLLPLTNWMYPVTDIPLPESFKAAPKPAKNIKTLVPSSADITDWALTLSTR